MYFGYHWTNSYGESDNGAWLTGLHDLDPKDILEGINSVRLSGREWPPSLPQFRALCKPITPPYFDTYAKLSKPVADPEVAAENIRKMQEIVKGKQ